MSYDEVVITEPDQVTRGWLTTVLTRAGALTEGAVEHFDITTDVRRLSSNAQLQVEYAPGSSGERPRFLFLKTVDCTQHPFGPSEVHYYTRDYVGVEAAPLVRCFDAVYSESPAGYHLLLEDMSKTHVLALDKAPTLDYALALADGFAAMHAHWWGASGLEAAGEPMPDATVVQRWLEGARSGVRHLLDACSEEIGDKGVALIEDLFEHHPRAMIDRAREAAGFTLIHGDANPTNVLVPQVGGRPIYIIDRQPFDWSLTTWLGVYDLSYAIVHRWKPETRRRLEQLMLRRYHDRLLENGVVDYPWTRLLDDYRLCAPMSTYVAVEWCRDGAREDTKFRWMPMLQKTLTALADLDARTLWHDT